MSTEEGNKFCKGTTHDKRYPYQGQRCMRRAWKDEYCKTHHPEEKARRNKERINKKDKQYYNSKQINP